jgi:hypothetical protein
MTTKQEFLQEVDNLLDAQKQIAGASELVWQDGTSNGSKCIKIPLEIEGIQYGAKLVVNAYPQEPGKFSILIIHHIAVCRLDVVEDGEIHGNFQALAEDDIPALVNGPHFHEWKLNRRLIEGANRLQKLPLAKPFDRLRSYQAALRWFCAETKIEVPYDFDFDLPARESLF